MFLKMYYSKQYFAPGKIIVKDMKALTYTQHASTYPHKYLRMGNLVACKIAYYLSYLRTGTKQPRVNAPLDVQKMVQIFFISNKKKCFSKFGVGLS